MIVSIINMSDVFTDIHMQHRIMVFPRVQCFPTEEWRYYPVGHRATRAQSNANGWHSRPRNLSVTMVWNKMEKYWKRENFYFLQGRDVPLFHVVGIYCYQFCRKKDDGLLEIDFVCSTSDSLTTNSLMKPLHVFCTRNAIQNKSPYQVGENSSNKSTAETIINALAMIVMILFLRPLQFWDRCELGHG